MMPFPLTQKFLFSHTHTQTHAHSHTHPTCIVYSFSAEPCKAKINSLAELPRATKRFQMLAVNSLEVDF